MRTFSRKMRDFHARSGGRLVCRRAGHLARVLKLQALAIPRQAETRSDHVQPGRRVASGGTPDATLDNRAPCF
jgi:hypothetical protein